MANLRYGIMGGSFNPIHYAHLFIANEVLEVFDLNKIIFMPTGTPPHKNLNIDSFHRYSMTKLAISSNPNFIVSDIEVLNNNISYTVDTISKLKEIHPNIEFYFITGTDAILDIPKWKEPRKLLSLCKIISVNRPQYMDNDLENKVESLTKEFGGEIILVNGPGLNLSSTLIRERVKLNKSIKYLVPDSVSNYILKNRLYN